MKRLMVFFSMKIILVIWMVFLLTSCVLVFSLYFRCEVQIPHVTYQWKHMMKIKFSLQVFSCLWLIPFCLYASEFHMKLTWFSHKINLTWLSCEQFMWISCEGLIRQNFLWTLSQYYLAKFRWKSCEIILPVLGFNCFSNRFIKGMVNWSLSYN